MRYTLREGFDRQIKKRVEKGTLFAVPIAVMAIVGLAAFTSNTTTGPGIGSSTEGEGGNTSVATTFQNSSDNQSTDSVDPGSDSNLNTGSAAGSAAASSSATKIDTGAVSQASADTTDATTQPAAPATESTGSGSDGSGGGGGCDCVQNTVDTVVQTAGGVIGGATGGLLP